jgi:tetratricopeptide (TPR) repeat protein
MQSETLTRQYEQALSLAEAGQYAQALDQMLGYLKASPLDGKALNDAGTLLFCMQRGGEAIVYFEKALAICSGDELTQVQWNLCEVYLQEGMPEKAAELFGPMRRQGTINADILNRAADAFLKKQDLGGAVETLLLSMTLYPDQEVLKPMLEIIRSHRQRVLLAADSSTAFVQTLKNTLEKRMPLDVVIGHPDAMSEKVQQAGTVIFAGAGKMLGYGLSLPKSCRTIVVLGEGDLYHWSVLQAHWKAADTILASASTEAIEDFRELTGVDSVVQVRPAAEPLTDIAQEKKPGKRIAAVGPWGMRLNPMFLIQCFQKLHYLDADMRLHFAGEFEDAGLERYIRSAVEAMDLDTVVFFDGPVKNLNRWFRDKHFVASTAIDSSAMNSIWAGMACGLKPVVHRFADAESWIDKRFMFTLAEDFCRQIQTAGYEPAIYQAMAQEQFESANVIRRLNAILCRWEQASKPLSEALPQGAVHQQSVHVPVFEHTSQNRFAEAGSMQQPIGSAAEQAMSVTRKLKELLLEQPSNVCSETEPVQLPAAASAHEIQFKCNQERFSVEPYLDTEPSAVPFAQR